MAYASQIANISGGIMFADGGIVETQSVQAEMKSFGVQNVSVLNNGVSGGYNSAVKDNIKEILGLGIDNAKYQIISSAGLVSIKLKDKLTQNSGTDTDTDSLTDWNEVNTDFIFRLKNNSGKATVEFTDLPTLKDCIDYYTRTQNLTYVENGLNKFYENNSSSVQNALKAPVLPINSDPTNIDSDRDTFLDSLNNNLDKTKYNDIIADPYPLSSDELHANTVDRIRSMHPLVRERMLLIALEAQKITPKYIIGVVQGFRSIEEQNELYKQGRYGDTRPQVTWVQGGYSYHNYGLAMDLGVFEKGDGGKYVYIQDSAIAVPVLINIGKIHTKYSGVEWGGNWIESPDYPHYEISFGNKASELLEFTNAGKVDKDGYVIVD